MTTIKAVLVNPERLTPREGEIATLMAEGLSDKDIARALAISIRTVGAHTANLYEKLGLRQRSINTRCTAIITMVARGMITLSIRALALVLMFNASLLDDESLRARHARSRGRVHLVQVKRGADA
jgi:DNA-binding NarL/FixJ family response regulator